MAGRFVICALLFLTLFWVFMAVESRYIATIDLGNLTVPPMTCDSAGHCSIQCLLPPSCFSKVDPCSVISCPNFPNASCATSCAGCSAVFSANGQYIALDKCQDPVTTASNCPLTIPCDPEAPIVACIAAPCVLATCPRIPSATCCDNFCGGCRHYFHKDGVNVTASC